MIFICKSLLCLSMHLSVNWKFIKRVFGKQSQSHADGTKQRVDNLYLIVLIRPARAV